MIRTFHPVGHGAFYTERFYNDEDMNIANVVFDCGSYEFNKQSICQQHIESLVKNTFKKDTKIDILFISHFHTDHINGVDALLKSCKVNKICIPLFQPSLIIESFLFNYITEGNVDCSANNFIKEIVKNTNEKYNIEQIHTTTSTPYILSQTQWQYVPYVQNLVKSRNTQLLRALKKELSTKIVKRGGKIDMYELSNAILNKGVDKCKEIYAKIFGSKNHNSYSMTLLSTPTLEEYNNGLCYYSCLYMGDYQAKGKFAELERHYAKSLSKIGLLQIPHHGSENNINKKLYKNKRIHLISAGVNDYYGHPDLKTLIEISNKGGFVCRITEDANTKLEFRYTL